MRVILIGKNSNLYLRFKNEFDSIINISLSHKEIDKFSFLRTDRILLLSYSRSLIGQGIFLSKLSKLKIKAVILFSSSSVVVSKVTKCYLYPSIKAKQEEIVLNLLKNVNILRLGTVVRASSVNKYRGTLVTHIHDLINATQKLLITTKYRKVKFIHEYASFKENNLFEYRIYCIYLKVIEKLKYPCILRPIDFIFKYIFKYKWYGYGILAAFLSGKLKN